MSVVVMLYVSKPIRTPPPTPHILEEKKQTAILLVCTRPHIKKIEHV